LYDTFLVAGKIYYYNAATRATQWTKPEGPDVKILTQDEVEKLQKKVGGAGGGDGDNNKQQSRDGGGQEDRGDRMGSVDRDQGSMDREMRGPGKKNKQSVRNTV
jgi:transcription elongation regulator 1